jgi:hypothetical protein
MKLRISGNSVRLRLTQSEVAEFAETGKVEDRIEFGGESNTHLSYAVTSKSGAEKVSAKLEDGRISVIIPTTVADKWSQTEQVGIRGEQSLPSGKTLRILIEKDFACLTPRPEEDESDNFPHPKSEKIC